MASKKILADLHVDGKVGVGTSTPGAKLQVGGTILSEGGTYVSGVDTKNDAGVIIKKGDWLYSDDNNYLRRIIGHGSDGNLEIGHQGTGLIGDILVRPGTSGNIRFFGSGSEDVRINSSGNVGIGDASPVSKLEVRGDVSVSDNADTHLALAGRVTDYPSPSANASSIITTRGDGGSYPFTSYGNLVLSSRHNSAMDILFRTSDTDRMVVRGNGNVGIGTSSPNAKLEVV